MLERRRTARESGSTSGNAADAFSDSGEGGLVTLSHGVHTEALPLAQMTVREIRERFSDRFDIDPESTALLDGNEVSDDTAVDANQLLMFVRRAGVKGFLRGFGKPWRPRVVTGRIHLTCCLLEIGAHGGTGSE